MYLKVYSRRMSRRYNSRLQVAMQAHNTSQLEEDEKLPPYIITSQIKLPRDVKRAAHFLEPARLSASHGPKNLSI